MARSSAPGGYTWRAVWKRVGNKKHQTKKYEWEKSARNYLVLLGPEPWNAFGNDPDAPECCNGYQCGCGGLTHRQKSVQIREELGEIEWMRMERRKTGKWEEYDPEAPIEPVSEIVEPPQPVAWPVRIAAMRRYFEYEHLPAALQEISRPFGELADLIVASSAQGPEQTTGLRKLLEAKDCAVRASLPPREEG